MEKVLLISEETIKKYSLANENIDGKYVLSTIQVVQDLNLSEAIGPVLLDKLTGMVSDGTITSAANIKYKELLDEYIQPFMVWSVMAQVQLSVNYKITNSGTIQNQDDKKQSLDYATARALQSQYQNYADSYGLKLQNHLQKHLQWYPEYHKCQDFQSAEDIVEGGIFFGLENNWRKRYIGK